MKKREKSAVLQFFADIFALGLSVILPFVVRTVLVRHIGMEYVGVSNLFTAILQVLSVTDFGLTTSLTYYLYKAAEINDIKTLNTYMGYFKKIFRVVGFIILIAGLMLMPLLPFFVKGKAYPEDLNIYIVYLSYILQVSLYYLTNIYISILTAAFLKSYLNSIIVGISYVVMYIAQIFVIILSRNYYIYAGTLLLSVFVQNILFFYVKRKFFPWLDYSGELPENFKNEFRKRMYAMIISKLRTVTRNSFDCIILSVFFGLTIVAEYQNYYQIMLVPCMFSTIIRHTFQHSLGNGIASETVESNYGIVKIYIFINNFITTVCMTCLLLFTQFFMKLWMGEDYLLGKSIVVSLAFYYFVLCISDEIAMFREVTGIWKEGKWIAIFESILNILLNVLFAKIFGLFGIVLATILTICIINIPLESYFVFKNYFIGKYKDFIQKTIKYSILSSIIVVVSYLACNKIQITDYKMFIIYGIASIILPTILFIIFHIKDEEMIAMREIIKRCIWNNSK